MKYLIIAVVLLYSGKLLSKGENKSTLKTDTFKNIFYGKKSLNFDIQLFRTITIDSNSYLDTIYKIKFSVLKKYSEKASQRFYSANIIFNDHSTWIIESYRISNTFKHYQGSKGVKIPFFRVNGYKMYWEFKSRYNYTSEFELDKSEFERLQSLDILSFNIHKIQVRLKKKDRIRFKTFINNIDTK